MTTFKADVDQMTDLASRLTSVTSALSDEAHGGFDCSALGDSGAVGAMQAFISGWSTGRSEISSGVSDVRDALNGAASNYRGTDQGMATRLSSGKA